MISVCNLYVNRQYYYWQKSNDEYRPRYTCPGKIKRMGPIKRWTDCAHGIAVINLQSIVNGIVMYKRTREVTHRAHLSCSSSSRVSTYAI